MKLKNKFIAIEGLDGSGKSTQLCLLKKYFEQKSIKYKMLHFPRCGEGIYGELIARFLRGEFGSVCDVHPILVSLLFAGDRNSAKKKIYTWLENGYVVLIDRYYYSNIAFQCAKLKSEEEKKDLEHLVREIEFKQNKIPQPDISLYLDVPFDFVEKALETTREGDDRSYLKGKDDIHESSFDLQSKVAFEYNRLCCQNDNFIKVECVAKDGKMLSKDEIHESLLNILSLH